MNGAAILRTVPTENKEEKLLALRKALPDGHPVIQTTYILLVGYLTVRETIIKPSNQY